MTTIMQTASIDRSKIWTVGDYLQLEEGVLAQLIDGELIMSPAPTPLHQRTLKQLFRKFDQKHFSGEVLFAPIDLYIDDSNVLQPDLVFIAEKQKSILTSRGIEGPPEVVVEIISPSNSFLDRNTKKRKYLEFGVREYWIVDPGNQTLEIYTDDLDHPRLYLSSNGEVSSTVIRDLSFDLSEVFVH